MVPPDLSSPVSRGKYPIRHVRHASGERKGRRRKYDDARGGMTETSSVNLRSRSVSARARSLGDSASGTFVLGAGAETGEGAAGAGAPSAGFPPAAITWRSFA